MDLARHVDLSGLRISSVDVKNVRPKIPNETRIRITLTVGEHDRTVHRELSFPVELMSRIPDEAVAAQVFDMALDAFRHELLEQFRYKGRPLFDPHPETPGYCDQQPWMANP